MGILRIFLTLSFLTITSAYNFTSSETRNSDPGQLAALDPETLDWIARVDSAGGFVSDSIIIAVDDYVKEIKGLKYQTISIRNLIVRENWYCGDFNAAFVPLFRNTDGSATIAGNYKDVNHNYISSEYSDTGQSSGLKGNGIDRYIGTGLNPGITSGISVNDAHFTIYSMTNATDSGRTGCRLNGVGFYFYPKYLNGNTYFSINSNSESNLVLPSSSGYLLFQRTSSLQMNAFYQDNFLNSYQNTSTSKPNIDITIGAFNNSGTISNFLSLRLGGYSIGKSFSAANELIHYNAVQRLMSRLGRKQPNGVEADFKSKLFTFTGNNLVINYQTRPGGYIQFELQDENSAPITDFMIADCPQISGNSYSQVVNWNNGSNLSPFVNTPVYLRIKMSNADLFSLQFKNQSAQTDSLQAGIKIGTYKQFFADTLLFGNTNSALRKMHNPVKNSQPVLSPTQGWEGDHLVTTYSNVAYSKSTSNDWMVYKMWLRAEGRPVYYESIDGINWSRPNLESYKFEGSMNNNIMSDAPWPGGLYTVVDDSLFNQSDSSRRYKSVYNIHTSSANSFLYASFSSDGIIWTPYSGNPLRKIGEDLSSCGWNPVLGKYLGYFRDSLGIRKVGRYLSDDWINWVYTGTVLKPDALDIKTTHFYNMEVLFKDSVYWGFAGHLQLNQNGEEAPINPSRSDNTVQIDLLFSRDGINFVRCGNRMPFIPYGELGSWDDQMIYTVGVPVVVGNEFYIYYNGFNIKHISPVPPPYGGGPAKSHIGLARIGLDRFVSLTAY